MKKTSNKAMVQPINRIFSYLTSRTPVVIWLMDQQHASITGTIVGFDEFMNLVLEGAVEENLKRQSRKELGRIILKGDTIAMLRQAVVKTDADGEVEEDEE